jgi:hypothetical protein
MGGAKFNFVTNILKQVTKVLKEKGIKAFWKGNGDDLGIGQNHLNLILSIC